MVLHVLRDTLAKHKVPIEYASEPVGAGPAKHMICYESGGVRVEFIWPGN